MIPKDIWDSWGISKVPEVERQAARELGKSPAWAPLVKWYDHGDDAAEPTSPLEHLAASVAKWNPARPAWASGCMSEVVRGFGWCYLCQRYNDACSKCPLSGLVGSCMDKTSAYSGFQFAEREVYADIIFEALLILYQREWFRVYEDHIREKALRFGERYGAKNTSTIKDQLEKAKAKP